MNPDKIASIEFLRERYPYMTKSQKRICDVLIDNYDVAMFFSLNELCSIANVTSATVVKFAHSLGFSGFSELKKSMQSKYQKKLYPRQFIPSSSGSSPEEVLSQIKTLAADEVDMVRSSIESLSLTDIIAASKEIAKAPKVYLVGFGLVLWVVKALEHRLTTLMKDSTILTFENYSLLPSILDTADKDAIFVIFTFPNYLSTIEGIAQCAKAKGCRIICCTDKKSAPAAKYADHVLLCHSSAGTFPLSIAAAIILVDLIAAGVKLQLPESEKQWGSSADMLSEYSAPVSYWMNMNEETR